MSPSRPGARVVGQVVVVLAQLVDHAGVLGVAVREVGRPDEAVGADERAERARRALAGVEADPALPPEVLLGVQRHRRRGPAVALLELVEAVHPVGDPAAAALEHRDLEARVPLEHAAVDEVRQRHHLVDDRDQRVVRPRRHQVHHRAATRPACRRGRRCAARAGARSPRAPPTPACTPGGGTGRPLYAFGRHEAADEPEVAGCGAPRGRGLPDPASAARRRPRGGRARASTTRRSSRCRPRHDAHRELGVLDAAELEAEAGVHHGEVDALGVEHLHPLVRVEPGRVQVLVVAAAARSRRRARPRCRVRRGRGRSTIRSSTQALVVARWPRSSAGGCRGRRGGREVALPEVGRLADVAVGVDDVVGVGLRGASAMVAASTEPDTDVNIPATIRFRCASVSSVRDRDAQRKAFAGARWPRVLASDDGATSVRREQVADHAGAQGAVVADGASGWTSRVSYMIPGRAVTTVATARATSLASRRPSGVAARSAANTR